MNQTQVKTQMLNIFTISVLRGNERIFCLLPASLKVKRVRSVVEERVRQAQTY